MSEETPQQSQQLQLRCSLAVRTVQQAGLKRPPEKSSRPVSTEPVVDTSLARCVCCCLGVFSRPASFLASVVTPCISDSNSWLPGGRAVVDPPVNFCAKRPAVVIVVRRLFKRRARPKRKFSGIFIVRNSNNNNNNNKNEKKKKKKNDCFDVSSSLKERISHEK